MKDVELGREADDVTHFHVLVAVADVKDLRAVAVFLVAVALSSARW